MEHPKHLAGLRDFSAQLAQRLNDAPAHETPNARLGVRVGSRSFLLQMTSVGEIVPLAEIARVPWTRSWFRGLANVRGRLVGVYDLPHLSGGEPMNAEQALQLLVLGDSLKVNAALLITRAFGLRNLKDLAALPAAADGTPLWEGARFRDADGTTLTELNLAQLLADERFSSIGV
jgi:twitching motility protein PilI